MQTKPTMNFIQPYAVCPDLCLSSLISVSKLLCRYRLKAYVFSVNSLQYSGVYLLVSNVITLWESMQIVP